MSNKLIMHLLPVLPGDLRKTASLICYARYYDIISFSDCDAFSDGVIPKGQFVRAEIDHMTCLASNHCCLTICYCCPAEEVLIL